MAWVVVQPGTIFRVARSGTDSARAVFLEQKVFLEHFEEGLLGFAFDPDYAQNGFVYIYWTEKTAPREGIMAGGKKVKSWRQSVISRFHTRKDAAGPVADPATELRVMEIFQPFGNHNGGTIVFGPDKMLYVALGDGGSANDPFGNGQDKGQLLGKVLRIDVRGATKDKPYAIPADNPFAGEQGARGEIWTWGMRNPWRITFDRATGDLWCGDVGQNRIEEVDRLEKGGNYGWNFMEGTEKFEARRQKGEPPGELLPPIAEYGHRDGLSVTGGYVYRGSRIPGLVGCFVYGDFNTFRLRAVKEDRKGGKHEVFELGRAHGMISSFAEEPDGELLLTCFDGRIYRIVPKAAEPAKGN
jgi:glucose/arabinose dehydrogenase